MYHYVGLRFLKSERSEKPESKIYIYSYERDCYDLTPGERYTIVSEGGYDYHNAIVEVCSLYEFEQERALTHDNKFCSKENGIYQYEINKIKRFKYCGVNPCCVRAKETYYKIKDKFDFSSDLERPIIYKNKKYRDIKEVLDDFSSSNYTEEKYFSPIEKHEEYTSISCGTNLNSVTTTGAYPLINSAKYTNNYIIDNNDKKENKTMNIFGNLDFGQYKGSDIKLSMKGLAYKTSENTYVAYDEVEKNLINVTDFIIDINNMIFMLPAAIKDVTVGDIINHNKEFVIVTEVNSDSNSIAVISPKNKEIKIIMPERNIFGFDFVSKVFCPIGANIFGTMDKDNPFGTMLPFLMMKEGNFDMKGLMLAQMMTNGGSIDFQNNPMMLYFLMEDKNNEMNNSLPYLMMMGNMANSSN